MSGTYASVKFDPEMGSLLKTWCDLNGVPMTVPPDSLHATVLYSRTEVAPIERSFDKVFFEPKEFKIFESQSERVLVILLNAPELSELHDQLIKSGGTHDYPVFQPHVTLSYQVSAELDVTKFNLPPLVFIPTQLVYEPLNEDWTI